MLGHIGRRAAVLAAKRKALQKPQRQKQNGSQHSNLFVGWKHANKRGAETHDQQRDQERMFATNQITDAAKHDRAKWSHHKSGGECGQREQQRGGGVGLRKEILGDDGGKASKNIKVVPLNQRARAGGANDGPDFFC